MNTKHLFGSLSAFVILPVGTILAQTPTPYFSSEDFQAAMQGPSFTEDFTSLRDAAPGWSDTGGNMGTSSYEFSNGFSFTASVNTGNLGFWRDANVSQHDWEGDGLATNSAGATMSIVPGAGDEISGFGGYFFATDSSGAFLPDEALTLTFSFEEGADHVVAHTPTDHENSFYGVTSSEDNLITGFSMVSTVGGVHVATSETTIGVIPEPRTVALLMALFAGAVVVARRRFVR